MFIRLAQFSCYPALKTFKDLQLNHKCSLGTYFPGWRNHSVSVCHIYHCNSLKSSFEVNWNVEVTVSPFDRKVHAFTVTIEFPVNQENMLGIHYNSLVFPSECRQSPINSKNINYVYFCCQLTVLLLEMNVLNSHLLWALM